MSFSQVWTRQSYQRDCPVCGASWQSRTIWTVMAMTSLSPRNSSTRWSPPETTRTYTESSLWTRKGDAHTAYVRSVLLHLYFFSLCLSSQNSLLVFVTPQLSCNHIFSSHMNMFIIFIITAALANYLIMMCGHVPIINSFIYDVKPETSHNCHPFSYNRVIWKNII